MSERLNKGSKVPVSAKAEPGRASAEMKPKKAAAHRQVIQDAAKYNQSTVQQAATSASIDAVNTISDDYEGGKVAPKRKASKYEDDIKMVQDLDRWG